jgi:protein-S-isoprenylcysteine O-methyltransferase Ste14
MIAIVVWRAGETFRNQGSARGTTTMRWSFSAMLGLTGLIFGGTVVEFFFVPRPLNLWVSALGLVLVVLAGVLRLRAIRALGRFWSLHVEVRERHEFIREGPYQFVRHPAYSAFVVEHVAVPLIGNAWWSLAAALLLYVPVVLLRLQREEAALVGKFGDAYRAYQQDVGALIPKWSAFRAGRS